MHGLNKPDQDKKKSVCLSMVIGQIVLSVIFRMYMYNRFLNTLKFEVYLCMGIGAFLCYFILASPHRLLYKMVGCHTY